MVPYITENNYYEIKVRNMALGDEVFNFGDISMMIDSGTTFTHFPTKYMKEILSNLNYYCSKFKDKCGKIENSHFK